MTVYRFMFSVGGVTVGSSGDVIHVPDDSYPWLTFPHLTADDLIRLVVSREFDITDIATLLSVPHEVASRTLGYDVNHWGCELQGGMAVFAWGYPGDSALKECVVFVDGALSAADRERIKGETGCPTVVLGRGEFPHITDEADERFLDRCARAYDETVAAKKARASANASEGAHG